MTTGCNKGQDIILRSITSPRSGSPRGIHLDASPSHESPAGRVPPIKGLRALSAGGWVGGEGSLIAERHGMDTYTCRSLWRCCFEGLSVEVTVLGPPSPPLRDTCEVHCRAGLGSSPFLDGFWGHPVSYLKRVFFFSRTRTRVVLVEAPTRCLILEYMVCLGIYMIYGLGGRYSIRT